MATYTVGCYDYELVIIYPTWPLEIKPVFYFIVS